MVGVQWSAEGVWKGRPLFCAGERTVRIPIRTVLFAKQYYQLSYMFEALTNAGASDVCKFGVALKFQDSGNKYVLNLHSEISPVCALPHTHC